MMKNLLRLTLLLGLAAGLAACSDDDTKAPVKTEPCWAEFVSTTIPATIPAKGGLFEMYFDITPQPKSGVEHVFVPWQFRVTLGDAVGNPVEISDPRTEVLVSIPLNYSVEQRTVVIETISTDNTATPPQWLKIVEAVQEPSLKEYSLTVFDSTTLPARVSCNGGNYEVRFKTTIETRADDPIFVDWQYRIRIGDEVGTPVMVTEPTDRIEVVVPSNYTENKRQIVVEMSDAGEEPFWRRVVYGTQQPGLMKVGDWFWATGNVTVSDGRFIVADKMSDTGLFFRNGSIYGVPSDADYAGTAYMPEPQQIALDEIPYGLANVDPCSMIDPALRTPSYEELMDLFYLEENGKTHNLDGIEGMGYTGSDFFIPYAGVLDVGTGRLSGRSSYGGYWGLGSNFVGEGVIYALSEFTTVDYDAVGTNMAVLRCVKNTPLPAYVSHTGGPAADCASFDVTVQTSPGEFARYEVALEADDGNLTRADVAREQPEARLIVPKNDEPFEREWRLFVNRIYAGVSFVQPGLKNYVRYVSHTPSKATYEAFTLNVTCESDLESFPVTIKGDDGTELSETGSKDRLTVSFSVPENQGGERKFSIFVNGEDTGERVLQEQNPNANPFSVIWSEGYLDIVNGAYAFAEPKKRGGYFKYRSKYAFILEDPVSGSSIYPGTVWGPERADIQDYADIPYDEVDPCSLVAPAGTWRMPTAAEYEELIADGVKEQEKGVYKMWSDGTQQVYFAASGQTNASGKILLPSNIGAWSSTPGTTAGRYSYLMMSTSTSTGKVNASGSAPEVSMMVRCVRER